jgi:hypothetical protein
MSKGGLYPVLATAVVGSDARDLIITFLNEDKTPRNLTGYTARVQGASDDLLVTFDIASSSIVPLTGVVTWTGFFGSLKNSDLGLKAGARYSFRPLLIDVATHADYGDGFDVQWVAPPQIGGSPVTAVPPTFPPSRIPSLSDYGAIGDGVTDDTVAVQNAVNATAALGLSLAVPEATYLITASINVPANTRIKGTSRFSSLFKTTNSALSILLIDANNVTVEDVGSVQPASAAGALVSIGSINYGTSDITLRRCTGTNFAAAGVTRLRLVELVAAGGQFQLTDCIDSRFTDLAANDAPSGVGDFNGTGFMLNGVIESLFVACRSNRTGYHGWNIQNGARACLRNTFIACWADNPSFVTPNTADGFNINSLSLPNWFFGGGVTNHSSGTTETYQSHGRYAVNSAEHDGIGNVYVGMHLGRSATFSWADPWRHHRFGVRSFDGSGVLKGGTGFPWSTQIPTLPDNTTPSVDGDNFFYCAPASATTITHFKDLVGVVVVAGTEVTIIFTNANATIQNNANIKLAGGVNFVAGTNDVLRLFWDGTVWRELSRSVNH